MRTEAVTIREPGDVGVLTIAPLELPELGPREVLVEVAAAGLNRADLLQRQGLYPPPAGVPQAVPGLEFAGRVDRVGRDISRFAKGDRVMGIVGGGAMARHVVAMERELLPVPAGLSDIDAAAVPEAFLTGYDALRNCGGLQMGQLVLVHAIASGIGTAVAQLARVAGAVVVGTSRSEDKLSRCQAIGMDYGVCATNGDFESGFAALSLDRGADLIIDFVGAPYLDQNLNVLALRGRLVVVGLVGGLVDAPLPLFKMMKKRVHIVGTVLRSRPPEEKASLAQEFAAYGLPKFKTGELKPVVGDTFPMVRVADAHIHMASNSTFGKVVLTW